MKKEVNITVTIDIPEGNALLSQEVLDSLKTAICVAKDQQSACTCYGHGMDWTTDPKCPVCSPQQNTLPLPEGYIVVDITWKRTLTFHNEVWLGTSNSEAPITVFNTVKEARGAIQKTIAHSGGNKYAWQKNNYSIIGVHKDNRALRAQQE